LTDEYDLNLDDYRAARREATGAFFKWRLGGEAFAVPAGLAIDVFEPVQDVLPMLVEVLQPYLSSDVSAAQFQEIAVRTLLAPGTPSKLVEGLLEMCRRIINTDQDPGQWERFTKVRPQIDDVIPLAKALWGFYGSSLGELFRSFTSSAGDGATSNQTSPGSTESTPETPSSPEEVQASSPSAA
jgi:hypothetical protein